MTADSAPLTLPKKGPEGHPPSSHPEFVPALTAAWLEKVKQGENYDLALAIPDAGPYRASFAGKRCDRELWYAMTGAEQSNSPGISQQWSFEIGHRVHEMFQDALTQVRPLSRAEVDVDLNVIGIAGSAHADLIVYDPCDSCDGRGHKLNPESDPPISCGECEGTGLGAADAVIEIKSVNATGWATMCTKDRGVPEGPRSGHVMQAALVGAAVHARRIIIIYVALENFSNWRHKRYAFDQSEIGKFTAEFEFDMQALLPRVRDEARRIKWVAGQQVRPPRRIADPEYPIGTTVDDPNPPGNGFATYYVNPVYEDGAVVKFDGMGTYWGCKDYCNYRDRCVADGR